jgi:hypothetical protein
MTRFTRLFPRSNPAPTFATAYSYSDRAWSQLANVFNKLSWMRQLGALLSPREMGPLKTIET